MLMYLYYESLLITASHGDVIKFFRNNTELASWQKRLT